MATRRRPFAKDTPIAVRLRARSVIAPSGCWIWLGAVGGADTRIAPYGRISVGGFVYYAHHLSYETFVGPVPDGMVIDHLCRRTLCINPLHLQAVSVKENLLRGTGLPARFARATRCPRGHLKAEHIEVISTTGQRRCRPCHREALARYKSRLRSDRQAA